MGQWTDHWLPLIIAIVTPLISIAVAWGVQKQWKESMDETVERLRTNDVQHFEHAKQADSRMARQEQRQDDHERTCAERAKRTEEMFREIRDGLNELRAR